MADSTMTEETVDTVVESMRAALGPRLEAVYRFGSDLARGQGAGRPRLLVLVDLQDLELLHSVAGIVNQARRSGIHLRLDTAKNLLRGADAFPAFALELMDNRQLLAGKDVLAPLTVDTQYLRLHVEHGLRGLRRQVVDQYIEQMPHWQRPELRRHLRKLIYLLEAALMAAGHTVPRPSNAEAILQAARASLVPHMDTAAWEALLHYSGPAATLDGEHAERLFHSLLSALGPLIDAVDQMPA